MSDTNPTLKQRGASKEMLQVLNKRDKNTRGLAKVVSATEYLYETAPSACRDAFDVLIEARQELIAERRPLTAQLLVEMDKQANAKGAA